MKLLRLGLFAILLSAAIALVSIACGGGDEEETPTATQTTAATAVATPTEAPLEPGVTATEIVLGQHAILSGPAAIYKVIPDAMKAYFEYVNETEGGVNGRKIRLEVRDNQYPNPAVAKEVTQELVERAKIFAMFSNFGTPTELAVVDYLTENKIPDMFVATGFSGFSDPVRKYAFGGTPAYFNEAQVMAQYINTNFADAKVGLLYQNDDFGRDYLKGLNDKLKKGLKLAVAYEGTEPDTSSQMAQLVDSGASVIVLACTPTPCANAIKTARQAGSNVQLIMSGVNNIDAMFKLVGDPAFLEGTLIPAYHKTVSDTADPAVQKHIDIMKSKGVEPSNFTVYGQLMSELMIEVLKGAGNPPTREGLLKAAENLKGWQSGLAHTKVCLGPDDHRPFEAFRWWKAEGGKWVSFGDVISVETTPNCG